jgi:hypothetical protein
MPPANERYDVASSLYYRYDAENRLINVSASPVLPPAIIYTYNGLGQQVEKNLSGTRFQLCALRHGAQGYAIGASVMKGEA